MKSRSAGPPQARPGPLGGQRSTRSDKRGGKCLTLFDLDHTLLNGDSDVLWCDFLIQQGVLEHASFAARNADMDQRYQAGTVGLEEFANFYVGTLAGRTRRDWEPLRQEFLATTIVPRIGPAALDLVNRHLDAHDLVVMTTATNRFITELTAIYFGIEHLIATEPQMEDGRFTGRTTCWPAVSVARLASSPMVRPVTVMARCRKQPASNNRLAINGTPPA